MKVRSWVAAILFLLFTVTMAATVNTSGHFAPESSPQFTFTALPTFHSIILPTLPSSTTTFHFTIITFHSIILPTLPPATMISSTPTLPPPAIAETDWAIESVGITPQNPQAGTPVTLSAVLVALSSTVSFPQGVAVECTIDGIPCGSGTVLYPGPAGNPYLINAQTPWIATPGTHTLTWSVSTNNDPNPSNNAMSGAFIVGPAIQTTTVQPTTQSVLTSTQPLADFTITATPPSQSVLQGQTVSYSVNVDALNGFNSQVSLSVSGLPSGANGVFSNPSGTPNFSSALTVTLPTYVSTGAYTMTVTGSGGGLTHVANLVLTVNAAPTTQTSTSPTQTSSGLMNMIEQNQLLLLTGILLLAAIIVAAALLSRRNTTPTQPTSTGVTTGMVYCEKCGTQNSTTNGFCSKCGAKLH